MIDNYIYDLIFTGSRGNKKRKRKRERERREEPEQNEEVLEIVFDTESNNLVLLMIHIWRQDKGLFNDLCL